MIHFSCPHCKIGLKAQKHSLERLAGCPRCGAPVEVPRSIGELAPLAEPKVALNLPATAEDPAPSLPLPDTLDAEWEVVQRQKKTGFLVLSVGITTLACALLVAFIIAGSKRATPQRVAEVAKALPEQRQRIHRA